MESPRPLPALTNDLLEEIFLRIGSPGDLVRASAASVNFRRLITDPSFLRRYRSLHPPLLFGLIDADGGGFQPAEAPHPSAALGRAVAGAADFSFEDYLPRGIGGYHYLLDVQGGRVLLTYHAEEEEKKKLLPHLAVCDPLARRCLLLPPIHEDRFASVDVQNRCIDAFLVPSGDEEDDTSFRVITRMICPEMVVAFIFSSATGHWSAGPSVSWDALTERLWLRPPSYLYSCFYWKVYGKNKWLKFDMSSMEFSADEMIEDGHDGGETIIAEAGEGRVGMFRLNIDDASLCYTIIRQIAGTRFDQLKMDNMIPLLVGYWYHSVHGPYEGHIFIRGFRLPTLAENACFTLEIKTLKIERVCQMRLGNVKPYFGFPPFMSPIRPFDLF
ncbi:hypothetical protein U9M48_037450 [Paspalum notatum var. saurae]|uniref:F-box domain-containing protein n=1 Tax=Paspalum notatum var. saurae TaxID=547442 RepID=A0AAQ3UL87_PASNO